MGQTEQELHNVKVDAKAIPDSDYETGCSVLASSVRCFFERPGVREEYEEWLKTENCS